MELRVWESFDLEQATSGTLSTIEPCNQVIHSWVFVVSIDEESREFNGIFVASDRKRRRKLYFVALDTLVALFRAVGEDGVAQIVMRRNADGERYITHTYGATDGPHPGVAAETAVAILA